MTHLSREDKTRSDMPFATVQSLHLLDARFQAQPCSRWSCDGLLNRLSNPLTTDTTARLCHAQ